LNKLILICFLFFSKLALSASPCPKEAVAFNQKDSNGAITGCKKDGHAIGQWIWFYKSGKIKQKGTLDLDVPIGDWQSFFEDGSNEAIFSYASSLKTYGGSAIPDKIWRQWYKNRQMNFEIYFDSGKPHGEAKMWYESGRLKYLGQFNKGKRIGPWKFWNQKGDLAAEAEYGSDGKIIKNTKKIFLKKKTTPQVVENSSPFSIAVSTINMSDLPISSNQDQKSETLLQIEKVWFGEFLIDLEKQESDFN